MANRKMGTTHSLAFLAILAVLGCEESRPTASPKTVKQYQSHCASCHEVGAANAPRRGDEHQWGKRMKKGTDQLVESIKVGLVAMPPRGGCTECSDEDFKALIHYMAHE